MKYQCPPTTAQTVVFPRQIALVPYNTDSYSPELTDDQVSSEEINQFFSKLQAASTAFHAESSFNLMNLLKVGVFYPFLVIVLPMIGSLEGMSYLHKYMDITLLEELFYGMMIAEHLLLYLNWVRRSEWKIGPFETNPYFEKIQDVVDEENETLRSRGFKWNLPEQFPSWIELTRDLEKRANEFQVETEEKISFNLVRGRYSKDFYSPEMTEGRVSNEEMHQMISKINPIIRKPLARPSYRWLAFFISCDVWILALIEINKHFPNLLSYFQISLLVVVFLILTIIIVNRVDAIDQGMFRVKFRARFHGLISEFNETLRSRGLRWHLPTQFPHSIELCKDYNNQIVGLAPDNQKFKEIGEVENQKVEKSSHRGFKNSMYVPLLDNKNDKKYE